VSQVIAISTIHRDKRAEMPAATSQDVCAPDHDRRDRRQWKGIAHSLIGTPAISLTWGRLPCLKSLRISLRTKNIETIGI
jgi:hypothetical protein